MLKGFIVLFTALISYVLFKKRFSKMQNLGIIFVMIGLVLVGLSNIHSYNPRCIKKFSLCNIVAPKPFLGNMLVILAQFFLAGMFVYEEKILQEYEVFLFLINRFMFSKL
jgi:drug/metabolite transporter (DMT)-like permease